MRELATHTPIPRHARNDTRDNYRLPATGYRLPATGYRVCVGGGAVVVEVSVEGGGSGGLLSLGLSFALFSPLSTGAIAAVLVEGDGAKAEVVGGWLVGGVGAGAAEFIGDATVPAVVSTCCDSMRDVVTFGATRGVAGRATRAGGITLEPSFAYPTFIEPL